LSKAVHIYGGRYEVTGQIGSGGMADVFLAKDNLLGRQVALKILHPEHARDRAFIERFRREAQSAARLNDPRVVSVFDWGSDNGTYYIVMEYVEGKTLRELIESGPLTVERAAEIAAEVCDALHLAHEQGIVHRDIKSGNILIASGGATKVTDFGIARAATASGQTVTQTGTVIGTAAYLSPEQAQGLSVDHRTDVYSASVVLYEMLTGEVPFKGDSAVAIAFKHVKEEPPLPSSRNPEVPPEMDAVVMKGLAKNRDNRYQSAQEMGNDLRRFLRAEPVIATPLLDEGDTVAGSRTNEPTTVVAGVDVEARTEAFPRAVPSRQRRTLAYSLTFLLVAGIFIAGAILLFSLFQGGRTEVVPNVVGLSFVEAERLLESRGLEGVHGGEAFSETHPAGIVSDQNPDDGVKVRPGSEVSLIVSKGPERVEVPDVLGKTQEEAQKILQDQELRVGQVRNEFSDTVEKGRVISQDPVPRTEVAKGDSVNLVISGGRQPVQVPNVIGLDEAEARRRLLDARLNPKVSYECDTSKQDDRVLAQDPAANTEVLEGSDVNLTVNDTAVVPSVLGQSRENATQRLETAGFKVSVQTRDSLPGKQNRVVDQDPVAGTVACKGETVTITVED
jgi:beta-lactam-binding protein with PASTA domain/predicted Ser/Thr protein kinase